jgi:plastocyanin
MKTRLLAVLAAACVTGAALLSPAPLRAVPAALAATRTVDVKDSYFAPKTLTVRKGTTVTFLWRGTHLAHNVAVKRGPVRFRSGAPKKKGSFSRTLRVAGTYVLHCEIHPGMQMTLKVR